MSNKDIFTKEMVLVVEYTNCPEEIKNIIRNDYRFRNDCYLEHHGEMWPESMTLFDIDQYYKDQVDNGYKGDIDKFIVDYNLQFEKWIIESGVDLSGVEKILISVCW